MRLVVHFHFPLPYCISLSLSNFFPISLSTLLFPFPLSSSLFPLSLLSYFHFLFCHSLFPISPSPLLFPFPALSLSSFSLSRSLHFLSALSVSLLPLSLSLSLFPLTPQSSLFQISALSVCRLIMISLDQSMMSISHGTIFQCIANFLLIDFDQLWLPAPNHSGMNFNVKWWRSDEQTGRCPFILLDREIFIIWTIVFHLSYRHNLHFYTFRWREIFINWITIFWRIM